MKPPALARRLLFLLLPATDRSVVAGDLDEEFAERCRAEGPRAAARWYRRQVLASIAPAISLRRRAGRRQSRVDGSAERERLLPQLAQDIRYAARSWRREPLFAGTAVVTQALGVAVAAAVLSVAYGVLVAPLPYANPDELLRVLEGDRSGQLSYADYVELRRSTRSLSHVVGFNGGSRTLTGHGGDAERVATADTTAGFFDALGVRMAYGRAFLEAESKRGAEPVAILTHGAWQRRFGGNPSLVGRPITLNGQPHTVVGVLPADFEFPLRGLAEVWVPLRPSQAQEERGYWHWLDIIGRRAPGITDAQVAHDLDAVSRLRAEEDPKWHGTARMRAIPLRDEIVQPVRPALLILLAGVALLFATATANVAGLVIARSGSRARELSVRAAIGAGPGRLARQLITESVVLLLAGSTIGLLGADTLVRAAVRSLPPGQRAALLHADRLGVTAEIAAGILVVAIVLGVVFGMLSRIRRADWSLARALTSRTGTGANVRVRAVLVAAEIALALTLVTGTGLLARSVYRLAQVSPGFEPRGLLTLRVSLPSTRYPDAPTATAVRQRLLDAFRAVPGVTGVATIDQLPLTGAGNNGTLQISGRPVTADGPTVLVRTVSHDYFDVMGIPLRGGRGFSERDREGSPLVVLANERLAGEVFGGAAIGERVTFEFIPGRPPFEIVGIVADEQFDYLDQGRSPVLYFPVAQDPSANFSIVIRADRPAAIVPDLRRAASAVDPELPLFAVRTMDEIASQSGAVFFRRAVLVMLGVFALAALLLAAVGVYGTLAYVVSQRTREIGIRVALGARRRDVVRLMLRHGMAPALFGAGLGTFASVRLTTHTMQSLLFGVGPYDPVTLAASVAFLCAVALAACLLPVARAARVDPAITLRQE